MSGWDGTLLSRVRMRRWARKNRHKPYVWGGVAGETQVQGFMEAINTALQDSPFRSVPTPEGLAEAYAERERGLEAAHREWGVNVLMHTQLVANTDGLRKAILELHAPQEGWEGPHCHGCDRGDGYDPPIPDWPCQTYLLAAGFGYDRPWLAVS